MSRGNRQRWSLRLARWHRWAGITAALFAIILAVTGLLLQHASALGLDRNAVDSPALARWLGFDTDSLTAFRVGEQWVIGTSGGLWLDQTRVADLDAPPTGAAATPFGLAVAAGGEVLLLEAGGNLIERLRPGAGLPLAARRLGRDGDGRLVVGGSTAWQPGPDWLSFHRRPEAEVRWVEPDEPPPALAHTVRERALAESVSWQRLLLELHSGRIGGAAGTFLMDLAAGAPLLLAGSGLYLWWRRR